MNPQHPSSHSTILATDKDWWLDPALAKLAFGSRAPRRAGAADSGAPSHLAFLSPESLEINLDDPQQRAFGDYELLELIGQGGMGVVYRARQSSLDREVAVKLLSAGPWASTEFIARFQREAQAAARMQHPNIVAIYETGVHEDLNFFSMQLVHGGSLANRLSQRGELPPADAARLLRTIAEAVDYAHRLDVLHLDLKPGNVLIDENGEPQVADFGLARRFDEVLALDNNEVSGTPSYMSPEQASSHALSPATDIYGLGAILYECLTGKPPFQAPTPQETLLQVVTAAPEAPRSLNAHIPADLDAICLKCLAKEPEARYHSARALADDLSRLLEGREVAARPLNSGQRVLQLARRERRLTALVALLFFSLVFGFGATSVQWKRAEQNAATSSTLLWEGRREAARRLEQEGKGFDALPRLLANIEEEERAGKTDDAAMERQRIGMLTGQGAALIDQMVIADANPLALELSPDGSLMAVALSDQSVRWYDTASLHERGRVSLRGRYASGGVPAEPRLLRFIDNHRLRVTLDWLSFYASPVDGDTWLIDLDRRVVIDPPTGFANFADASYSGDGRYAMVRNRSMQTQLWQASPWRPRSAMASATAYFTPWLLGPDARYAASLVEASKNLILYDLPDLSRPHLITLPGDSGISAWSHSGDGHWLALGDFDGRVFLLDPRSRKLRLLPTPHSREITWLAFSEDDAWLAAVTQDGTAYAFDVLSGNPLVAGQMQQDFSPKRVGVSHRQRLLIVAGRGETALWRLPQQRGPRAVPAQRVGAGPIRHLLAEDYSIGWSLDAGLMASAGLDGQVRLWRLPLGPTPPARAAFQIPEATWYDGRQLVDVEWNQLRVVSPTGTALTPWMTMPQPPGFAELLDGGHTLLVSTGPQLRVFDPDTLRMRYPPIPLVASPEHLVASADGTQVAVTFSGGGPAGFEERVQIFDLRSGRRRTAMVALAAPLRRLAFSPDGSRLLVVGPAEGATTVLATSDLHVLGDFPHDEYQPVLWADFSTDGKEVLMVTHANDLRLGNDAVITWDPVADVVRAQHPTGLAQPLGVLATDAGPFVAGINQDVLDPGGPHFRNVERLTQTESTAVLAISRDRRLIAHAFRHSAQLYDAATGASVGLPLQGDDDANSVIVQLAFAPDGSQLLARTMLGDWMIWRIAPETRPVGEMAEKLGRESIANENQRALRIPSAAERLVLRARDRGPWPAPETRPSLRMASTGILPIPARSPGTSLMLLDLSAVYTFAPETVRNLYFNIRPQLRPLPVGVQRIAGTDYDLRGLVQVVGRQNKTPRVGSIEAIRCLAVPPAPVSALHMLLQMAVPIAIPTEKTLAFVRLHYRDGGTAILPIRTQREVPGYAGRDQTVPTALAIGAAVTALGLTNPGMSNFRLANPFPERPIQCLDLEIALAENPLILYAITAEPAATRPKPVISPAVVRNHQ